MLSINGTPDQYTEIAFITDRSDKLITILVEASDVAGAESLYTYPFRVVKFYLASNVPAQEGSPQGYTDASIQAATLELQNDIKEMTVRLVSMEQSINSMNLLGDVNVRLADMEHRITAMNPNNTEALRADLNELGGIVLENRVKGEDITSRLTKLEDMVDTLCQIMKTGPRKRIISKRNSNHNSGKVDSQASGVK